MPLCIMFPIFSQSSEYLYDCKTCYYWCTPSFTWIFVYSFYILLRPLPFGSWLLPAGVGWKGGSLGQVAHTWLGLYPRWYKPAWSHCLSLSPRLHAATGCWLLVLFDGFLLHSTAAHTSHSSMHYIHHWCHYSPHLMLLVNMIV